MKPQPSQGSACIDPAIVPRSVRVLKTLGHGRAARAELVDAEMPDGRVLRCVEKVFDPGLLTRTIYRCSFQSPFAYQSNRDAILASFYRRRVAAAVLAGSKIDVSIAAPIYVRFEPTVRSWVLGAEWINGRGIKPAPADPNRVRRWLAGNSSGSESGQLAGQPHEVDVLVETMGRLETMFERCGLVGSGWQVAPRALVSTANLLRTGERYTIIDLESGIPAVLVPRYLLSGLRDCSLPPFDDLDAQRLRSWIDENKLLLTFRIGEQGLAQLRDDSEQLITHTSRWKESEVALARRPWRLLGKNQHQAYRQECFRRWQQNEIIDQETAESLPARPIRWSLIWLAGLLPFAAGRFCSRLFGRNDYRQKLVACWQDREVRAAAWQRLIERRRASWITDERISEDTELSSLSFLTHLLLATVTPSGLHRFLSDSQVRRDVATNLLLLMVSRRYQSWFGHKLIDSSIDRWTDSGRIPAEEAKQLRRDLSGCEVRAYTRAFGMHVALKALAPVIVPAKVGGIAAFLAGGSPWFLLPIVATPLMRTAVTLASWWTTRHEHIPHAEALAISWLPVVGSTAFPMQMFAARPRLSTFLIRDAAAKLGRRVPIYGGADSRTEIALIRTTDLLVELMECISLMVQRISRTQPVKRDREEQPIVRLEPKTGFGRRIDRLAIERISQADAADEPDEIAVADKQAA